MNRDGSGGRAPAPFPSDVAGLAALARASGHDPVAVDALAGDVGRRRYFRLHLPGARSVIGVLYPPEEADARRRWVAAQERLGERVRVPAILADDGRGHQLVEDFGAEDLAARFDADPAGRGVWLARAADAAAAIAAMPDPRINPPFDTVLFGRELALAREAVFEFHLGTSLTPAEAAAHDRWADALVSEILGHPSALCHRDFHANNLFPSSDTIGIIDFQDLRTGPDAYDLASLLWERTTLDWMTEAVARQTVARFAAARDADARELEARLSRVLLQRAWKVCGTFARAIARGKGEAYRRYLTPELALVRRLLTDTPEDRRFAELLAARAPAVC
jgi:N-acetylmuramate 1-kinase